jgi:hypothetical protein
MPVLTVKESKGYIIGAEIEYPKAHVLSWGHTTRWQQMPNPILSPQTLNSAV